MLEARFRPMTTWPGKPTPSYDRRRPFKAPYMDTLNLLESELRHLAAKNIIIEAYFNLQQIRNDGWPYSNVAPKEPGVAVSFDSMHGPMRIHCDACKKWEHNLRAIAMHLNHLRMSGIYGVGKDGQQYRGWKQLPGPIVTTEAMSIAQAAEFVGIYTTISPSTIATRKDDWRAAYRDAIKQLHPDALGKETPEWHKLQEAAGVLDWHHGSSDGARQ